MENDLFKQAINPHQYDTNALAWEKEGVKDSPTRRFLQEYLRKHLVINGKRVLDVGSGMGQLFPLLKELGAIKIEGIEPSVQNVESSLATYPDIPVFQGTLLEAPIESLYDVIIAVMVFEHIDNILNALDKINSMLTADGTFALIVANKEYHLMPRFDYKIESQNLEDGEVVIKTIRPHGIGTLYDILRPLENYLSSANKKGFKLEKHIELKPTDDLIKTEPKYTQFAHMSIHHLMIFKKSLT